MFSISFWELAVIELVIIIVVNPKDYPQIAYFLGEKFSQLRHAFHNLLHRE